MSSSEFVVSGITLVYVARTIAPSGVQCMKAHAIYLVFKDFAFSGVKSLSHLTYVYLNTRVKYEYNTLLLCLYS